MSKKVRRRPPGAAAPADAKRAGGPRVYSYARLSTNAQLSGDGKRRQSDGARQWALQNGETFDEELSDIGVSAFTGDNVRNGALSEFLRRLEAKEIPRGSILVLESLDRMSRQQVRAGITLLLRLLEAGVDVVTLGEGGYRFRAASTGFDQMVELMLAIVSLMRGHEESATKSKRVGDAWSEKRKRARATGEVLTRLTPGWLEVVDGKYRVIPNRARIVLRVFKMAVEGFGKRRISDVLNKDGVEAWGRGKSKGAGWHASYVQKILQSEAVRGTGQPHTKPRGGKRTPTGEPIDGYFPRIVSEDLWFKAQIARRNRLKSGGPVKAFRSLLRGLCFCGACGAGMAFEDKGKKGGGGKLVCGNAQRKHICGHRTRYRYGRVEVAVLFGLSKRAGHLIAGAGKQREALGEELETLEARVPELELRRDRLVAAIEAGAPEAMDRLRTVRSDLETALSNIKSKRIELEAAPSSAMSAASLTELGAALKKHTTADERRALNGRLRRLIRKIEFHPAPGGGSKVVVSFSAGDKTTWYLPAAKTERLTQDPATNETGVSAAARVRRNRKA